MMKLWIDVIGGESDEERVVATGGFDEIEKALDEFESEVDGDPDKYWELETDDKDIVFNTVDEYYNIVKNRI